MMIRDSKPFWRRLLLAAALFGGFAGVVGAQTGTWTGGGANANWKTAENWSGTPPTNNDTLALVFGAPGALQTTNTNDVNSLTANSITFNGNSPIYTLNGNAIDLGGNISNTGGSNTINLNLVLTGTRTIDVTGGNLTINGVISGGVLNNLIKTGGTDLLLTGANTYTGDTIINGGVLNVTSLADGGIASSIGDSGAGATNLVLDGGTLRYVGSVNASTNRLFTLGPAGGTISSDGSGTVNFTDTGSIVASGTGNHALTLAGGNTGDNILAAAIVDPSSGATSVAKTGAGTWILTGANTYSGGTTVSGGVLRVSNLTGSGTGTGAVTVNGGTLRGRGTIAGAVTVNSGGTIRGGNPATTVNTALTLQNGLTVSSGGRVGVALFSATPAAAGSGASTTGPALAPTSNTFLSITGGTTTISPTANFEVNGTGLGLNPAQTYSYRIAAGAGDQSGLNITDQARFTAVGFDGGQFLFSVTGNAAGAIFLNIAPVSEPATVLGIAAVALLAGVAIRRKLYGASTAAV